MADPDLQLGGGGGEASLKNNFFRSFGPQFALKKGGTGGPLLDPPLKSRLNC